MSILLISFALLSFTCGKNDNAEEATAIISEKDTTIQFPLGGNTWAKHSGENGGEVANKGIVNWANANTTFDSYIRINKPGTIKIKLRAKAPGKSRLQMLIANSKKEITVTGNEFKLYEAGEWKLVDTGYIKINIAGLDKTSGYFAEIDAYEISGSAINSETTFTRNNEGNFFYWGRRGPSVHLSYPFADSIKAIYFYNEVTVPVAQDVMGSYFMADGFGEGYFGMQVNSETERRILFSVWSPYETDNPSSIPDSMKIVLLKKGEGVHTGEFGNEGSGGQSYLQYNWKAGNTYRFLLKGEPDNNGSTIYSAWFFAPEKNTWMLIASFKRPQTNTYLKRFHSFLENFIPEEGDKARTVLFGNQWIYDVNKNWLPLHKAVFTYDNTAAKGYRKDYAGGVEQNRFFLRNCGFFNKYTLYKSLLERQTENDMEPAIDFNALP
ncbi:MAG: DUF3472 domain-containing protein [Agriterribacter sp.]